MPWTRQNQQIQNYTQIAAGNLYLHCSPLVSQSPSTKYTVKTCNVHMPLYFANFATLGVFVKITSREYKF